MSIKVRDDGSGVVTVMAVLDADAVRAAEAGGGKLEDRVRLADLTKAGWSVQPWARAADGSAQITLSKPFDSPAQVAAIMDEVSGKVGPLRAVTVTRDRGLLSTNYDVKGAVDLAQLQTGITTDPGVVASLTNQQVDVNAIDQSLLAGVRDSFALKVEVDLPGAKKTFAGVAGKSTPIEASSSVLDSTRVVLLVVAVVLIAMAVLVLLWPGRRRRRGRGATRRATP
ncbi:MAG: hypothetical protein QOF40_2593 [Actinomycetota bacterium]|nr:hypothetical protein [Actinomycetota bacterium]